MAKVTWLADALRHNNMTVRTVKGWKEAGRPPSTGTFAPRGVLIHHTAGRSSLERPFPSLNTVIHGRSDLPGPLCHLLVGRNGNIYVIAAGRANHAGKARASGPMPAGDGNSLYVGIEIDYHPDYQAVRVAQRHAALKAAAIILRRMNKGPRYMRGHKETSVTGKIDPSNFGFGMDHARTRVGEIMRNL